MFEAWVNSTCVLYEGSLPGCFQRDHAHSTKQVGDVFLDQSKKEVMVEDAMEETYFARCKVMWILLIFVLPCCC